MQLEHIKAEACPDCGSRVVQEVQKDRHVNGQWNEWRQFKCGMEIHYSPNFRREEEHMNCPKSPETIGRRLLREKAREKLEKYIENLDVDQDFKDQVRIYGL